MLRLESIAKFYGEKLILKDVSLHIPPGSVTLLAGPNGSGKSTLVKIMAGLAEPAAGKRVLSEAVGGIGYLGHPTCIYPELSALENLAFWARLHKTDPRRENLMRMLERMDLSAFAEERAGGFSRGMGQRLNLARVLLPAPDLLLLDEPSTGLDTASCAIMRREVGEAKKRGAAVVWITHNVAEDLPHADFIALLGQRTITHYGPAGEYGHA